MKISEYVKNKRKNRSILDYSRELGISNTQLTRIENGFWDSPSPTQLNNLCKIFNLTEDDLDMFNIPEDILYKSTLYSDFERSDLISKCINNFYNNSSLNGKSFKSIYNPPKFEDVKNINLKFLTEGIDAVCISKINKSDFIPFYFVDYKRTYVSDNTYDYDYILLKYYSTFLKSFSRMLVNGKIKKAIIITNSKNSYNLIKNWFNSIPNFTANKKIILAYCSIKNKGCELYFDTLF